MILIFISTTEVRNKNIYGKKTVLKLVCRLLIMNPCVMTRSGKLDALRLVRDIGFFVLENVPTIEGQVLKVISELGYTRETNYGALFEVRTEVNPNNLAYTNMGLGSHTDNPYRDPVPTVQLLHCLDSSTEGGDSVLVDGFKAGTVLRQESKSRFRYLDQHLDQFSLFR